MQLSTVLTVALAPLIGPMLWKLIQWPGKKLSELVWKYMPYGKVRDTLLREADPFAEAPQSRQRSEQAQRCRRPR